MLFRSLPLSLSSTPYTFISGAGVNYNETNFTVINTATGGILDFTSSGNTISVSGTSATLTSAYYAGNTVDVIATVAVSSGDSTLITKTKNSVNGNNTSVNASTGGTSGTQVTTNLYQDLTNGQVFVLNAGVSRSINLYVSDVKNKIGRAHV